MSLAERFYRLLLRLYPAEHRRAYGELMLLHARDLERAARQNSARPLLSFYFRLFSDGIRNAAIERLEVMMTNNRFTPAPWLTVLLAAIPGLLIVLSRRTAAPGLLLGILPYAYLGLLLIGIPLFWRRNRRFPAWALLPAGLLAWFAVYLGGMFLAEQLNTFGLLKPFSGAIESGIFLIQLILTIILSIALLHGRRLPLSVWLTLSAILLVNLIAALQYLAFWPAVGPITGAIQFLTVSGFSPIEGLYLVAVGLLAVRQHGLIALLVVIGGYSYMCLDSDYYSGLGFNQWVGYSLFAVSMISLYLIVAPVAMLRARTRLGLALAAFLPFSIFQLARAFVPMLVLQSTIEIPWQSIGSILTLTLAWFLYDSIREAELEIHAVPANA